MFFRSLAKIVLFVALFISFNANAQTAAAIFNRPLFVGSTGADVKYLQQVLNRDPRTQVAFSGTGSSGFESFYFGYLTEQAVMKFQTLNSIPSTGTVGPLTRAALNNYVVQNNNSSNTSNSTSDATSSEQDAVNSVYHASITIIPGFPYIDSVSPKTVTNGDYMTIYGRYFSTTAPNVVSLSFNDVSATSTDGTTLRVQMKSYLNDLFDTQMRGQSSETRRNAIEKTGTFPLFITVQTDKGVSNPFMIYFKLK